jgi:anti-sigma factor RsiW
MSEHLSAEHVARYGRRATSPAELLAVDDHVATCETCRQRLSETHDLQAALRSLRADLAEAKTKPEHLSYEQLAAYLDDQLNDVDREIVDAHAEICSQCAAELHDLKAFKPTTEIPPPVPGPTLWDRFVAVWRVPGYVAATAGVAVLVSISVITVSFQRQVVGLRSQLSQLQQANNALQKQAATVSELQAQVVQLRQAFAATVPSSSTTVSPTLEALPLVYQQTVKRALSAQRVETPPVLAALIGKRATLLGGSGEGVPFALLSPVATVVETARPTFRWQPLAGATSYVVTVYDSNFNPVESSRSLARTEWRVSRVLERGAIYSWQVTALKNGKEITSPAPPAPEAKFEVLEEGKARELERVERSHASFHLILGILYADAGLLDEAERQLRSVPDGSPDSSVARSLLRSLRALRRPKSVQ